MSRGPITIIYCRTEDIDETCGLAALQAQELEEFEMESAQQARLTADRCERCYQLVDEWLTLSGDDALCGGCLDEELKGEFSDDGQNS